MDRKNRGHAKTFACDARAEGRNGLGSPEPHETGVLPQHAGRKLYPHGNSPREWNTNRHTPALGAGMRVENRSSKQRRHDQPMRETFMVGNLFHRTNPALGRNRARFKTRAG
jgi:hypothetical protein